MSSSVVTSEGLSLNLTMIINDYCVSRVCLWLGSTDVDAQTLLHTKMTEKVGLVKSWSFLDRGELNAHQLPVEQQPTILGYLGDEINSHEDSDPYATKIGGFPNWLNKSGDANFIPICEICGKEASLVMQAYSPLEVEAPDQHRVLYVFVCANSSHKKNWWHVIRSQIPVPPEELEEPEQPPANQQQEDVFQSDDNWGADTTENWDSQSDWKQDDETSNEDLARMIEQRAQEIQTFNTNTSTQSKQTNATQKANKSSNSTTTTDTRPHFIPYYIDVDEEPDSSVEKKLTKKEAELLKQYESLENVDLQSESNETWSNEEYESVSLASSDKIFLKFQRRLARSPEQCLRYSFGGEPLWMTDQIPKDSDIPDCPYCGARRIFEMQLLPTLLSLKGLEWRHKPTDSAVTQESSENGKEAKTPLQLLEENNSKEARVDFGIVTVYSCSQSCTVEGEPHKKEWVFIQDSI